MALNRYGVQKAMLASVAVGLLRSTPDEEFGFEYRDWLVRGMSECVSDIGYDLIDADAIKSMALRAEHDAGLGFRLGFSGTDWASTSFATSVGRDLETQGGSLSLFQEIRNNLFPTLKQADVDAAEAYGYAWGMDNRP